MRYSYFLLLCLLALASCSDNNKKEVPVEVKEEEEKLLILGEYVDSFHYKNLSKFSIDSLPWEERPNHYTLVDEDAFNMIWHADSTQVFSESPSLSNYFYSTQNRNTNFKEITVLAQSDGCCTTLWYMIYDKEGRFVDKFEAASSGADGEWYAYSSGNFIDYNNYILTSVNHELAEVYEWDERKEVFDCDSTITQFTIGKDGVVSEKNLLRESYKKEMVR